MKEIMIEKIIILDSSVFVHRSIFSWASMIRLKNSGKSISFIPPVAYTYFQMLISSLTKVGVDENTVIIFAQDGRDSWRKDYYAPYKAQRKELRESFEEINWAEKYSEIKKVIDQLKNANFGYWIQIPKIEADDICAVIANKFQDKEVVIVTIDADLKQLTYYPNTKFFSLMAKYKGVNGAYSLVENPLKIITDKAKKGDVSDNILVDKANDTVEDYELREYIINLIKLPQFVTEKVIPYLENLKPSLVNIYELPYQDSLAKKFTRIYDKSLKIEYEDCILYQDNKKERTIKRKKKMKEAEKKMKVILR